MCTLRNFPHLIDHCIEWARAKFEDLFADPAQKAAKVIATDDLGCPLTTSDDLG
jgi:hypothetical protein